MSKILTDELIEQNTSRSRLARCKRDRSRRSKENGT